MKAYQIKEGNIIVFHNNEIYAFYGLNGMEVVIDLLEIEKSKIKHIENLYGDEAWDQIDQTYIEDDYQGIQNGVYGIANVEQYLTHKDEFVRDLIRQILEESHNI